MHLDSYTFPSFFLIWRTRTDGDKIGPNFERRETLSSWLLPDLSLAGAVTTKSPRGGASTYTDFVLRKGVVWQWW